MSIQRFVPSRQPTIIAGARLLGLRSVDEFQVAKSIRDGFSTATVGRLARSLEMTDTRVLDYLGIPVSTFHKRKSQRQPLSPEESSRVYRVAKVVAAAESFFEGDSAAAGRWLANPKTALAGATPLEFARTPEGSDYVANLLARLEHGIVT